MESDFLGVAGAASGRHGSWGATLGLVLSLPACSSTTIDISRSAPIQGDGAPTLPDGRTMHAGDGRTGAGGARQNADAGSWSDAGVFTPVDSGRPRPPPLLCTGSGGGAGAPADARSPSCTWERCPGAVALSLGPRNCVRMSDGTVRCTSDTGSDLVDQGITGVQALVSGRAHHCALRHDQTVWCWGDNEWGALGDPSLPKETVRTQPAKVPGLSNVVRISTRDSFNRMDITCALDGSGAVTCWGGEWPRTPTRVPGLAGSSEIGVADLNVCGLRGDTAVRCAFTDGSVSTYLLNDRAVDLVAAFYMVCARTASSDVFCMGAGGRPAPSLLPELRGSRLFAAGLGQVCAMLPDGTVGCSEGSEGSTFRDRCEGTDVVDLKANQLSLCALRSDGTIRCSRSG